MTKIREDFLKAFIMLFRKKEFKKILVSNLTEEKS